MVLGGGDYDDDNSNSGGGLGGELNDLEDMDGNFNGGDDYNNVSNDKISS